MGMKQATGTTQPTCKKELCVLFPGFGYGPDKPLLYYAARVARQKQVPVLSLDYSALRLSAESPQQKAEESLPAALADAERQIPLGFDRYVLVAKSFGTLVAASWARQHPECECALVQLTPLCWAYDSLYRGMPAFYVSGTADPLGSEAFRRQLAEDSAIETLFVKGGNHSLDTPPDYAEGLEAMKQIVAYYGRVL